MLLKLGVTGPEVLEWQNFLNKNCSAGLQADGVFGPATRDATITFQHVFKLDPDGIVGPATAEIARGLGWGSTKNVVQQFPFVQAKYYTPATRTMIDLVVIHTMENTETPGQAMNVANWFANKYAPKFPSPKASCHYCIDDEHIVQCVLERDVAWHADAANRTGIGLEHSGRAAQSLTDWNDAYSAKQLQLSSGLVADICKRYQIPVVWLTATDLRAGKRGITGHVNVTQAYKLGNHVDPGPNFPIDAYLAQVASKVR
jgi:hypothetical protein